MRTPPTHGESNPPRRTLQRTTKEYARFLAWLRWGVESPITPERYRAHLETIALHARLDLHAALAVDDDRQELFS